MYSHSERIYHSVNKLVDRSIASKVHAKDFTLYGFSDEARTCAQSFMGWADLASNPPVKVKKIAKLADSLIDDGIKTVLLVGQGGSTQSSMALTKLLKHNSPRVDFRILDSDSPIRFRQALAHCKLKSTLVVVSSKSGGTLEMRCVLAALRTEFLKEMSKKAFAKHLVAITDPGSPLEALATKEKWAAILPGEPTVGGRFSALSVFGLLPAALFGINIKKYVEAAREMEQRCSEDVPDNPAIRLAAFLYDNYKAGRARVAFVTQKRARSFALWSAQLVAESTGKEGEGILPFLEVDTLLLEKDAGDRSVVVCSSDAEGTDEYDNFQKGISMINPSIPRFDMVLNTAQDIAEQFVIWEYATAMCGYLMKICPFDQPDVASTKAMTLKILDKGMPEPDFIDEFSKDLSLCMAKVRVSPACSDANTLRGVLKELFSTIKPGDYFSLNAFLPFAGEGRREALESIRHKVSRMTGVPAALEIGPRYLHSTGQLHKGGANEGVFLVISADEKHDIPLKGQPAESLAQLAEVQAAGDAQALSSKGRRCIHLHFSDNSAVVLKHLSAMISRILVEIKHEHLHD